MIGYKNKTAVLILMAAVLLVSGCAMKRDVVRIEERVIRLQSEQTDTKRSVERLDSLLTNGSDETIKLRAEIRSTVSTLLEEFRAMQTNFADLQSKLERMSFSGGGQQRIYVPADDTTMAGNDATITAEPAIPGVDCQELYDESFINVRRSQYEEAIAGFTDYLQYCGTQDLADNARFWIGEAYYSMEKYEEAIREFRQLEIDYSGSEKRPGALYKMARSYEELGKMADAKATFQKLANDYPGTLESEQAKEKLKELK